MNPPSDIQARWMIRRDMADVLRIEGGIRPAQRWTEDVYIERLRQRNCIGLVAADEGTCEVLGAAVYELHRERLELIRLVVSVADRRNGVATRMLRKLIRKIETREHVSRRAITANVPESNYDVLKTLQSVGFRAIGIDRGAFDDLGEDGYLMRFTSLVESVR